MKNLKIARGILIGLCVLLLAGCGVGAGNTGDSKNTGGDDANALFDSSAMQGSVISFSDTGCLVSPVTFEDGGQSARVDAPGNENMDTAVNIRYQANCQFQIAQINSTTGKMAIGAASVSDIKKYTSLIIYGDFENARNLTATKVIIARYE